MRNVTPVTAAPAQFSLSKPILLLLLSLPLTAGLGALLTTRLTLDAAHQGAAILLVWGYTLAACGPAALVVRCRVGRSAGALGAGLALLTFLLFSTLLSVQAQTIGYVSPLTRMLLSVLPLYVPLLGYHAAMGHGRHLLLFGVGLPLLPFTLPLLAISSSIQRWLTGDGTPMTAPAAGD